MTRTDATPPLRIRNLVKEYVAAVPVLRGISLDFAARGVTAIIGPSGTGKSTLMRCINRLVEPTSGQIFFEDRDVTTLSRSELRAVRRRTGMVFQEYNLVERLTVMENVLCGRLGYVSPIAAWLRRFPQRDIDRAYELLDTVGLGAHAHMRADTLSGGQRQRVGIARAAMQQPRLLLADEPTSSLDPKTAVEIMSLVQALAATQGFLAIVNLHNVELARRFADRIIGMAGGEVVFDGRPDELHDNCLRSIYGGEDWLA
jgi:phosphonate transport system ATP-binding protein